MRKSELIELLNERSALLSDACSQIAELRSDIESLEAMRDNLMATNCSQESALKSKDNIISDLRGDQREKDSRLREFYRECEELKRELCDTKRELDRVASSNNTLLKLIEQLQPKENQNPVECEKGEWCKACAFNKKFVGANEVSKYKYTLNFNPNMWICEII